MSERRVVLTIEQARKYGLVSCKCGHTASNHHSHDERPCAHCDCKALNETRLRAGKWLTTENQ